MRSPISIRVVAVVAVLVLAAACLLKISSHTLYLEPDGALVWTSARYEAADEVGRKRLAWIGVEGGARMWHDDDGG